MLDINSVLTDIYYYYSCGGYASIIVKNVNMLITSYLLLFIVYFLINCVDYGTILYNSNSVEYIWEVIHIDRWFPSNIYMIICFVLYIIYLGCITIRTINAIKYYSHIKHIYLSRLNITDADLSHLKWSHIVDKLVLMINSDSNLNNQSNSSTQSQKSINIFNVNNVISKSNNFIIAFIRNGLIKIPEIFSTNKFVIMNMNFCIIQPFDMCKYIYVNKNNRNNHNNHSGKSNLYNQSINMDIYKSIYKIR